MEQVGSVVPGLLTKTMQLAASSQHCELHGLDVAMQTVTIVGKTISVKGQCPACLEAHSTGQPPDNNLKDFSTRVQLRRQAGVPERYLHASLDDFHEETPAQKQVAKQLRSFIDGEWRSSPGLLFLGGIGTAKTLLGAALVNYWLNQHGARSAHFYTVMNLLRRVKATWNPDAIESESLVYQRLSVLPLLVVDEIGVQFGSPTEKTILTEIVNSRYNALHPTVLIANLTITECVEVLGERVMDRFRDGGHALAFTWPSQRGIRVPL
ncbi:MAG: ATP-binding protein [Nitrospira sp.]|nr:ATP-binding protein [Nitrospira sp.]